MGLARLKEGEFKGLTGPQFDIVLGQIDFDAKGEVTGFDPWQW